MIYLYVYICENLALFVQDEHQTARRDFQRGGHLLPDWLHPVVDREVTGQVIGWLSLGNSQFTIPTPYTPLIRISHAQLIVVSPGTWANHNLSSVVSPSTLRNLTLGQINTSKSTAVMSDLFWWLYVHSPPLIQWRDSQMCHQMHFCLQILKHLA